MPFIKKHFSKLKLHANTTLSESNTFQTGLKIENPIINRQN